MTLAANAIIENELGNFSQRNVEMPQTIDIPLQFEISSSRSLIPLSTCAPDASKIFIEK